MTDIPAIKSFDEKPAKDETMAWVVLVLAIAGLFLSGIVSVIALVLGYIEKKKNPSGLLTAGIVVGWIGVAITAFFIVLGILLFTVIALVGW